ncbi:MAG TPA: metallophosphoesterase, partial [Deltaproteobacteria bacterium]|nr:metallophosphoesterase [Deltaproteobacteria bacterium]
MVKNKAMADEGKFKIGVISDTHLDGFDGKLKSIVARHFHDVDMIFHAGDLVDLGVLDVFGPKEVKAVCGNMDSRQAREKLPEK